MFLVGPSGSGKSSLLNLIAGLVVPKSGRIVVGSSDMAGLSSSRRDKLRADGTFVDEAAPASSFYHIVCAILELDRAVSARL